MNSPEISIDIITPWPCKFSFALTEALEKQQASHASEERHGSCETRELKIYFAKSQYYIQ